MLEQRHRRHDLPALAVATLHHVFFNPRFLNRSSHIILADAFNRYDRSIADMRNRNDARTRRHAAEIRSFAWQQIRILELLGEDPSEFTEEVRGWTKPSAYTTRYESGGNPLFQQEVVGLLCRERLGNPPERELAIAAEEQRRITRLRLLKLLSSLVGVSVVEPLP